ncbi:hypothetical protein KV097_02735 [Mumia sp. zg.B17]|uniref:hypothetical protein n=1 Tax=Mumia sp. zg.B17 TaxID=2855446 RepID=UPI001C6E874B|nr:hypothetical protein [Mumia sp. zg.B17]MBW9204846.1 hypothetical protein [Mumia sp. zg.B17]
MHRHALPLRTPVLVAAAALTATVVLTTPLPAAADDAATYEQAGKSVDGGASAGDATGLEAGDWKDTIGLTGTAEGQRWYTVKRTVDGSTVRFAAAVPSGAPTAKHKVTVEAFAGNTSCGKGDSSSAGGGHQPIVVASAAAGAGDSDECVDGDAITFSVTREVSEGSEEQTDETLEIRVVEEPTAKDAEQLPTKSAELPEKKPPLSDPEELPAGGVSFDEAVSLDPGAYEGTISPGETQIYRVDLDWGQSLDTVAQFAPVTAAQATSFDGEDVQTSLVTYAPSRAVATDSISYTYGRLNEYSSPELRSTTPFVLYNARENSYGTATAVSSAGPYYVVVAAPPVEEGSGAAGADLGFTLGVAVNGEVSGTPDLGDQAAVIGPDLDGGSSGWLTWVLVGLGVLLVLAGVAAVLIARRRAAGARAEATPYGGYTPPDAPQDYPQPYGGQQAPYSPPPASRGERPGDGW